MHEQRSADITLAQLELANQGDESAIARILVEQLSYWQRAALSIARNEHEADDLVQDTIVGLIGAWRRGAGPASNVRAYGTAMMRNAYASAMRSPRSKAQSFHEIEASAALPAVHQNLDEIDLSNELAAVRRALDTLSPEHREVLIATVAHGEKPAELVERFGRPAPAISSLSARAKQSLHRALLLDYLATGEEQCIENSRRLPRRVFEQPERHKASDRGLTHVRSCDLCQRNWRRFGAVVSALGVLPLLTVAQLSVGAGPAAAADSPGGEAAGDGVEAAGDGVEGDGAAESQGAAEHGQGEAASTPTAAAAAAAPSAAVPAAASAATAAAPALSASAALGAKLTAAIGSKAALVAGIALVVLAAVAFFTQLASPITRAGEPVTYAGEIAGANPHGASFNASLDVAADGSLRAINVHFEVAEAEEWSITQFALTLSPGTELRAASNGLQCSVEGSVAVCLPTASTQMGRDFVFEVEDRERSSQPYDTPAGNAAAADTTTNDTAATRAPARGQFTLDLVAEADSDAFSGRSSGTW